MTENAAHPLFQVTFDAADPRALATFWCVALGYIEQPPPSGFDNWEDALRSWGLDESHFNDAYAIIDPQGRGPRLFFQKVPEPKTAKNRVHLDVNVPGPSTDRAQRVREHALRLAQLGAVQQNEFTERGEFWIVLQDPEGNEFCVQ